MCTHYTAPKSHVRIVRLQLAMEQSLLCVNAHVCLCGWSLWEGETLRLGVNGSGSLMLRGKALRMRFLIWMQLGGMTSQNE